MGSSPDEGTRGIAWYQRDYHYRTKKLFRSGRPFSGPLFCFKGRYLEVHQTYDDTEMATIRRSGSGWQVLIRRKNYVGPRSRTFLSRDLAQLGADAVEERTKKVFRDVPITLGEAIKDYIKGPLLLHRSAENEKYPLRVTAESWLGDIPLKDLQIMHFAI